MVFRVKVFVAIVVLAAVLAVRWASNFPSHHWLKFVVYLVAVLLISGFKVAMPNRDGTMSVNFPFILLSVVDLSPGQAIAIAAMSVAIQCRIKVLKPFTFVQIAFNIANVMIATTMAILSTLLATKLKVEVAPALALASVTFFFANTIPVAAVIGWSGEQSPFALWRREFPWYLPFYLVGAFLAAVSHFVSFRYGQMTSLMLIPVIYTMYRAYRAQMLTIQDRKRHLEETEALHLRTIEGLAMAIEAKDQNTHEHLNRVRLYVSEIAKSFDLSDLEIKALVTAAFLHDIGKLAVPEHILNKPGKLTVQEFEVIKTHPGVGAHILERVRFPYPVVPIVRSHHEAWDGSGYPDGLKGEEIPIGARILTVVDCFDALISDRPYRKAMPWEEAMALLKRNAGTQFDPRVVEVLERRYPELEQQARKQEETIARMDGGGPVWRGAAPAAGFEIDQPEVSLDDLAYVFDDPSSAEKREHQTRIKQMDLIVDASLEAQAIFEMGQASGAPLRLNETISVMSSRLRHLIAFDCFSLYLLADKELTLQYTDGEGTQTFSALTPIPFGEGLSGWVAQTGKAIVNGNPGVEPNYVASHAQPARMHSALSLPLRTLNGDVFGVLTLCSAVPDAFSKDHLRTLQAVELKFSMSLQRALALQKIEKDVSVDLTTQLPNLRQFLHVLQAELNKASRMDQKLGLIVCNLDSFKAVNDRHGHLTGDSLLRSLAAAFVRSCRSYDIVACIGGDEFVFLLPGMDAATCSRHIETIGRTVHAACRDLEIDVDLSASVGAAFYPANNGTAEELLAIADRRMFLQKSHHHERVDKLRDHASAEIVAAA